MALISLGFTSCTKNEPLNDVSVSETTQEVVITPSDIEAFREDMINSNSRKNGTTIPVDSAITMAEATFNYCYGYIDKTYILTTLDTAIISFNYSSNETIAFVDMIEVYITINNSIYDIFQSVPEENKHVKFIDLILMENNELYIVVGTGIQNTQKNNSPRSVGDGFWLNSTPFNDEQEREYSYLNPVWPIANPKEATNSQINLYVEVCQVINEILELKSHSSQGYIYNVESTDWSYNSYDISFCDYYEPNPHITGPDGLEGCEGLFNVWATFIHSTGEDYYSNYLNEFNGYANYKDMNKYYNVINIAILKYKPENKEMVDAKLGSFYGRNSENGRTTYYSIGMYKLTYASKSPYPDNDFTKSDPISL